MIRQEDVFPIGRIGKPHGIKGEVLFHFDDDIFDRLDADYLVIEVDGILVPFFIEEYRFRSDTTAQVKFCGIDSQEQARELTHCNVFFERSKAEAGEDELSWSQIIGFTIVDSHDGHHVGTIQAVDDSTINILFETVTPDGKEVLIPASDELIEAVDMHAHTITIALPEGLLSVF